MDLIRLEIENEIKITLNIKM